MKRPLPPITPAELAEQVAGFDAVFLPEPNEQALIESVTAIRNQLATLSAQSEQLYQQLTRLLEGYGEKARKYPDGYALQYRRRTVTITNVFVSAGTSGVSIAYGVAHQSKPFATLSERQIDEINGE